MATVVDALVVMLGLDPKDFTKGQKQAAAEMLKTRQAAEKHGAGIEKSMDAAAEAVDRLARNALKLFAIFTAGRAVKEFVSDITAADAAMGRLAKSIGSTPEAISSLANAVARNGGSASAAAGSFERLSDSINELKTTGNSSILPVFARLQGISGRQIRLNTDLATTFGDIAEAAKVSAEKVGVSQTSYLLKQAGYDQGTIALLIQGRAKLNEALEKSRRIGIVNERDTKAAQALETSIESLRQTSESFGRSILTTLTPTITDLLERFQRWITANQDWIRTGIVENVKQFATWIKGIDWDGVGKGLQDFGAAALKVADAFGGILKICETLFLFWVGSKAIAIVRSILGIAGLLSTGPLGWALRLAMAGSIASDLAVPNAEKPGVITRSDDENTGAATGGGQWGAIKRGGRALWRGAKRLFGGGEADAAEGGAGIRTRAVRAGRGDQSGGVAANPGAYKDVLDHIARSEGTANEPGGGYSTSLAKGLLLPGGKEQNLTGKSLDEIDALQTQMLRNPANRWNSSAIGRYQIVRTTLRGLRDSLGLKGTDLYDEKLQDRLGAELARRRGADPVGLRQEWASLVGAKNATAVALMQKVDPKASTMPLDKTAATDKPATAKAAASATSNPDGSPLPTDGTGVNNDLMRVVKRAQEISAVKFHIHEGLRTLERQKEMVDRGWSKTYNSKHLTGRAIDVRANGDPAVGSLDGAKYRQINEAMKKASVELGVPIQWGGDSFGKFKDVPHFQLPDGFKSNAGAYGGDQAKVSALSAQQAGAQAAIAQQQAAQAAMMSSTSNDNRSTDNSSQWHIENLNLQTAATDGRAAAHDFRDTLSNRAFAAAANRGLA